MGKRKISRYNPKSNIKIDKQLKINKKINGNQEKVLLNIKEGNKLIKNISKETKLKPSIVRYHIRQLEQKQILNCKNSHYGNEKICLLKENNQNEN